METFKIQIESELHSRFVQKKLFAKGYKWNSCDIKNFPKHEDKRYLYGLGDGYLSYGSSSNFFDEHESPEIEIPFEFENQVIDIGNYATQEAIAIIEKLEEDGYTYSGERQYAGQFMFICTTKFGEILVGDECSIFEDAYGEFVTIEAEIVYSVNLTVVKRDTIVIDGKKYFLDDVRSMLSDLEEAE